MSGLRAGVIVFAGIAIANGGNYLFQLIAARWLGPGQYGDLAALVAVAALVTLPLAGIQAAVARDVASLDAAGQRRLATARIRYGGRLALAAGLGGAVVLIAFSELIRRLLDISSLPAVVMTLALVVPAFVMPLLLGWLQGVQRFALLSATVSAAPIARIALLGVAAAAGSGIGGATGATLAAAVIALVIPLIALHRSAAGMSRTDGRFEWTRGVRRSFPVIAGLLAVTALSTIDIVVANMALDGHDAGIYGSASLIARVILYLSTAVVTVLLPKVSERAAQQRETSTILSASLLVTAVFSGLVTIVYAALSGPIVSLTVGSEYERAAPLLWIFALAMSGYSLLNVLLFDDLGRGRTTMVKLLVAGAALQLVGFALFHGSVWQLVIVSASTAGILLVAHELFLDASLIRAARGSRAVIREMRSPSR
jgi:O-antigen/teichoic acid export membrane protein